MFCLTYRISSCVGKGTGTFCNQVRDMQHEEEVSFNRDDKQEKLSPASMQWLTTCPVIDDSSKTLQ
jgi:hypothetical protein